MGKFFINIISLDSSQRVPPMSPCPPLIITRVCPLLINPLSDPWDFNKQILSNPMEFYEDLIDVSHIQSFMVQKMLIIKRGSTRSTLTFWGGVINPVLALLTLYRYNIINIANSVYVSDYQWHAIASLGQWGFCIRCLRLDGASNDSQMVSSSIW